MSARYQGSLWVLALSDPDQLHAMLADPTTHWADLSWGAEVLGGRWTPDRWWPTLRALLQHERFIVREGALDGLGGWQTEPDEPMGAAPVGFYVRNWPADAMPLRDEILTELDRIARADAVEELRMMAANMAAEVRTGERYATAEDVPS